MNTVTINNMQLPTVEYRGQRVVTFAMIDEVHQRPDGTAGRNFRENKSRLIEGEDYFELGSDEIRRHLPDGTFSKFAASGIVLVESGYLMLVKSFIVELEPFMAAFRQMMSEAEPRGTRWYHPKMGLFQAIGWEDK